MSPNEALIRYQVKLLPNLIIQSQNLTVEKHIESIKERQDQAIQALNQAVNASPPPRARYNLGDQVWLKETYLKVQYQSSKLAPKRYGPFQIVKVVSLVAYCLQLPITWKIHDVFHTSLLSPYCKMTTYRPNFSWPPPDLISGEEEFEVKSILNHQCHRRSRTLQYLVKWRGYLYLDTVRHRNQLIKYMPWSWQKHTIVSIQTLEIKLPLGMGRKRPFTTSHSSTLDLPEERKIHCQHHRKGDILYHNPHPLARVYFLWPPSQMKASISTQDLGLGTYT